VDVGLPGWETGSPVGRVWAFGQAVVVCETAQRTGSPASGLMEGEGKADRVTRAFWCSVWTSDASRRGQGHHSSVSSSKPARIWFVVGQGHRWPARGWTGSPGNRTGSHLATGRENAARVAPPWTGSLWGGGGGTPPHLSRRPSELRTIRDRHGDPGVRNAQNSITRYWRRVGGVLAMRGAEGFWPTHTKNVTLATSYRARAAVGRPTAHTSSEGI
jgi:hypothetical protein